MSSHTIWCPDYYTHQLRLQGTGGNITGGGKAPVRLDIEKEGNVFIIRKEEHW